MSVSDILALYRDRFGHHPKGPNQLMSFSRQTTSVRSLKWIEARGAIRKHDSKKALPQSNSTDQAKPAPVTCSRTDHTDPTHIAITTEAPSTQTQNRFYHSRRALDSAPQNDLSRLTDFSPSMLTPLSQSLQHGPSTMLAFPMTRGLLPNEHARDHTRSRDRDSDIEGVTPVLAAEDILQHILNERNRGGMGRGGEDDSLSTTLSLPPHELSQDQQHQQHQTQTISEVSGCDRMHELDPQTDDVFADDHLIIGASSDTCSFGSGHHNLSGLIDIDAQQLQHQRDVLQSLQNKLSEMSRVNERYLGLRAAYLSLSSKQGKQRRINLSRTKQAISDRFHALVTQLKAQEQVLLGEAESTHRRQSADCRDLGLLEESENNETQRMMGEHTAALSRRLDDYEAMSTHSTHSTHNDDCGEEMHRQRMAHFAVAQQDMTRRIEGLREETHLEFVAAEGVPSFAGEFGRLFRNVPRPGIEEVHVLGNDRLSVSLSAHSLVGSAYAVRAYQVLFAYESNCETENDDEKQEKMQWESVEVECNTVCDNWESVDIELEDLNLVHADLMLKVRLRLAKVCEKESDSVELWTLCSDIYQLTQRDLLRSATFSQACLGLDCIDSPFAAHLEKHMAAASQSLLVIDPDTDSENEYHHRLQPLQQHSDTESRPSHSHSHAQSRDTVCLHEESAGSFDTVRMRGSVDTFVHSSDSDDTEHDDEHSAMAAAHVDLVRLRKDLYFEQAQLSQEMVHNQQLMQQFMVQITAASHVHSDLTASIHAVCRRQELWNANRADMCSLLNAQSRVNSDKQRSSLTLIQSVHSPRSESSISSAMSPRGSPSSGCSLNHAFAPSFSTNMLSKRESIHSKVANPSLTEQFVSRLVRLGRRSSASSSSSTSSSSDTSASQMTHSASHSADWKAMTPILSRISWDERLLLYGELCHIMQENPRYVSSLTNVVQPQDLDLWLDTVICGLFGEDNDSRSEHLLLRAIECMLTDHVEGHGVNADSSSECMHRFLDDNTNLWRTLETFMTKRCPENANILQMILRRPMEELMVDHGQALDLELDPEAVCRQLATLRDIEATAPTESPSPSHGQHRAQRPGHAQTSRHSTMTSGSSSSLLHLDSLNSGSPMSPAPVMWRTTTANANEASLQKVLWARTQRIQVIVTFFLDRLIEHARAISFGIRWVCRSLWMAAQRAFPAASTSELNATMGRVLYRCYLEPALAEPLCFLGLDHEHRTEADRERILRNFQSISDILQSILCGPSTDDKHTSGPLSEWMAQQRAETTLLFYEKLLDVDAKELRDRLAVGRHLMEAKRDVTLRLRQLHLIHHTIFHNAEAWNSRGCNQHIPLLDVLDRLDGDAPDDWREDGDVEEEALLLDLTVVGSSFNPFFVDEHYDAEEDELPDELNDERLLREDETYVRELVQMATAADEEVTSLRHSLKQLLATHIAYPSHILYRERHSVRGLLDALCGWAMDSANDSALELVDSILARLRRVAGMDGDDGYNAFAEAFHCDITRVLEFSKRLQLKAVAFAKARDAMVDHTDYLQNKLAEYEGRFEEEKCALMVKLVGNSKGRRRKRKALTTKMAFSKLVSEGVIIGDGTESEAVFHIGHRSADCFVMRIVQRKQKKKKNKANSTLMVSLVELLSLRDSNHAQVVLQSFTFDVQNTIELLNNLLCRAIKE